MVLKRTCKICGATFYVPPKQASRKYCDRESCKEERHRQILEKDKDRYARKKKKPKKVCLRPDTDDQRRCRRCGSSCYPNYFFCQECHHAVSAEECFEDDDRIPA